MGLKAFFLENPVNLGVAILGLLFIGGGVVALSEEQALATMALMLIGFGLLSVLEYRRIQ
ncbi:MAG: hypothetical protein J07HX64_01761 [halophilic archaeon J07HX64]|jgi:hypothetical protein|nr:MAG: hypothetical protein J07HX64_01761 [halophilic archaeon J07HX64]